MSRVRRSEAGTADGHVGAGAQRMLPAGSGWLDVSNPRNPEYIDGGMDMNGTVSYQESTGKWILMRTHGQPLSGAGPGFPFGRYHEEKFREAVSYAGFGASAHMMSPIPATRDYSMSSAPATPAAARITTITMAAVTPISTPAGPLNFAWRTRSGRTATDS